MTRFGPKYCQHPGHLKKVVWRRCKGKYNCNHLIFDLRYEKPRFTLTGAFLGNELAQHSHSSFKLSSRSFWNLAKKNLWGCFDTSSIAMQPLETRLLWAVSNVNMSVNHSWYRRSKANNFCTKMNEGSWSDHFDWSSDDGKVALARLEWNRHTVSPSQLI